MQNGLKPSIRALRGAGFNRALPSPYEFGNAIYPDGVNDIVTFPALVGVPLWTDFAVEFWIKTDANYSSGFFAIVGANNLYFNIFPSRANSIVQVVDSGNQGASVAYAYPQPKTHIIVSRSGAAGTVTFLINGGAAAGGVTSTANYARTMPDTISSIQLFTGFNSVAQRSTLPTDDFRIYNRVVSPAEAFLNYNAGIGENPSQTEGLITWLQFEKMENLGSPLQGGFPVDIRDMSVNNNHGRCLNMVVDPGNASYVLKAF